MKSSYRYILVLLFFLGSFFRSHGSHMIGGDIVYSCLGGNRFEITLTLFQDCQFGEPLAIAQDNPAHIAIYPSVPNPSLQFSGTEYAAVTTFVDPNFSNACINNYPSTCLRMQVFKFQVTLPPSSVGYDIVYQRCCRNASINNLVNPGNIGVTYSAHIPPFKGGECPNNSARFKTLPPQIICSNNPFVYDFSATDPDNDSLSYELCAAKIGGSTINPLPIGTEISPPPFTNVDYLVPYSIDNPIPGTPPIKIHPVTGLMTGTPNVTGRFVVTVCVKEWRNGQVINTLSRDVQFVVTNCSKAVVADIPELSDEPNTYQIQCKGFKVDFVNNSTGGFSYFWEFGVPGATSTSKEPSYVYPDTGTYEVKLVVNKGSTCPDSITRFVKIYPEFHADFGWTGKLCPEEPIFFHDSTMATYMPITNWTWDFGDGDVSFLQNPVHIYGKPGGSKEVTLSSKSKLGCRDTITKTLPLSYFNPFAGNDTIVVLGYDYELNARGSVFYEWTPTDYLSDPFIPNPKVMFPDTGLYTYVLRASNEEGCVATDTIRILVVRKGSIFVPNAFSPNGDGKNDRLEPKIVGYSLIVQFAVFNRYGQLVYSASNDNYPSWDGTFNGRPADVGVYYYYIKLKDEKGRDVEQKGDVTLIR